MIKSILIDDEPNALRALEIDLTTHFPQVVILKKCTSATEGLQAIKDLRPQLVFLDIDMPDINGFELLNTLENIFFDVIFCTGFSKYAVDAFHISEVVHYITKPIQLTHLKEAILRVETKPHPGISKVHFDILIDNLKSPSKISLRGGDGTDFITIRDILYCQSDGNYITVFMRGTLNKKNTYSTFTLKNLEERLPQNMFCRIHQSYLINLNHVTNFQKGTGQLTLDHNKHLPVSRSGKIELIRKMNL